MKNDNITPDRFEMNLTPKQFWDLYFDRLFIALTRTDSVYEGMFLDYKGANKSLFIQFPKFVGFTIQKENLHKYQYQEDNRFQIPDGMVSSLLNEIKLGDSNSAQIQAAIDILIGFCGRPTLTFKTFNEKVLFISKQLPHVDALDTKMQKYLDMTFATAEDKNKFEQDGRMDHLHAEKIHFLRALTNSRAAFVHKYLLLISESPWEHESVSEECLNLIGQYNQKEDFHFLLSIIDNSSLQSRHMAAIKALQYMCSGKKLIEIQNEATTVSYWKKQMQELPSDKFSWLRYDAQSVFWEKRFYSAREIIMSGATTKYSEIIEQLWKDEVLPVRNVTSHQK